MIYLYRLGVWFGCLAVGVAVIAVTAQILVNRDARRQREEMEEFWRQRAERARAQEAELFKRRK